MSDKDSAALDIVEAIFTDIRGRAVIKWLFDTHGSEHFIAKFDDGEELRGIDLEVQGQIKAAWQVLVREGLAKFSRPTGWRCFHCDEVFTTEQDARLHFGMDQCSDPACKIKLGAEKSLLVALHRAETELQDAWAAIHNESTEAAKAYYAQQSRHGEQLRAAEEHGYERAVADSATVFRENDELRAIISKCADALGTGAFISQKCTMEFMQQLPAEISSTVQSLRSCAEASRELASWAGCINWRGGENQKEWLNELRQHISQVEAITQPYIASQQENTNEAN
ncbi:hypothetical protein [Agrobacterium tumefaciens]|uniref:hypothetical protein n=1 Tax=Agrobacterium tumefaciens TaxID=358 RepID=UPI0021CE9FFF|nr:hypothetical protein [Agrobacterium tumefaciens]UXS01137.1 hypothetical protein FY156_06340 [Agrobacterium tumefaciens]